MDFNKTLVDNAALTKRIIQVQRVLNTFLNKFGLKADLAIFQNSGSDMITLYQKMNLFHFLNNLLDANTPGDIVEMGCYDGQTATLLQTIVQFKDPEKKLYLFDNFKHAFGKKLNIKDALIANFKSKKLNLPVIVEGFFTDTVPQKLPGQICFLHIDCGYGGNQIEHKNNILHILNNTYDRLVPGAVVVLMDYHVPGITLGGYDANPGVKMACDEFFVEKPEKVHTLYGGMFSHGYFRKGKE